ncbi:carbohydrate binding family 9 domain-containing protein [Chitinimonas sp.]|uniref:carbohydrate binding family 9 domain-containing protein n=1 Tax=Chitinimonas sp. TaxID=1934313 RepID=UPI002F9455A8
MKKLTLLLALAFALPAAAAPFNAYHLGEGEQIVLDGKLDEAVWQKVPRNSEFFEHTPNDLRPAMQGTAVRFAYDSRYLYVALEAKDPNPAEIREPFARRDKVVGDQDFFVFYLDPAGDSKSAQFFRVNPRGAIGDGMYTDTGGEDFSPDYEFEAASGRTADGWVSELRIPFSALAYNNSGKEWRVMVLRSMTRGDRYRLTSGPIPRDTHCFLCYSAPLSGMTPPTQELNWSVTPQLLLRRSEKTEPDGSKTSDHEVAVSMDVKVRPRSDWVLDLTVNPDFSQVELDTPALAGNSRFAVFFPEKRPFFLEGADLLQAPDPQQGMLQVIHSRAITDPAWGGRATWRGETADMTVLTTRDDGGGLVVMPGAYGNGFASQDFKSQATIAHGNLRRGDWLFGGLFTDRTLTEGRGYNRVAGGEATWQFDDHTRIRSQLLWSETTAQLQADGNLAKGELRDGHALFLDASQQTENWNYLARYNDIGQDFRADDGFITQTGIRSFYGELNRKFGFEGDWRERNPYLNAEYVEDRDRRVVSRRLTPGLFLAGPYDSFFNLEWHGNERVRLAADGPLLKRDFLHIAADGAPSKLLNRLTVTLELGDQIDYENNRVGKGGLLSVFARMRLHERFELEQNLDQVWVDGGKVTGNRAYKELAYQWNSIWHFSARDTARLIWQHGLLERNQAAYAQPVSRGDKHNTWSLVYAHKQGLSKALYVGATIANSHELDAYGRRKQNEVFVKGSWTL